MRKESIERDYYYILDMIAQGEKAVRKVAFAKRVGIGVESEEVFDGIIYNLSLLGEPLLHGKLSEGTQEKFKDLIDWKSLKGFRNLATHDYGKINPRIVLMILNHHLPETLENLYVIKKALEKEIENL